MGVMEKVIPAIYTGLYILFLCIFIILAVLSAREELPTYARDPPLRRPVRRMALWLIRRLQERREKRRRKGKDLLIPGEEGVRNDLRTLYPSMKAGRKEVLYRMEKFERSLLLLFAAVVLAGAIHVRSFSSGILQEGGNVRREESGGADRQLTVRALPALPVTDEKDGESEKDGDSESREGSDYGTYTVTVHARQFTRKEAEDRAQEILGQFPESLLGENESADRIRSPLVMPQALQVRPFTLSWESSRYAVLDTDGSIFNTDYRQDQAEEVELTAVLTCGEYRFQKKMDLVVRAPLRDEQQKLQDAVGTALLEAEKESADREIFKLPDSAEGLALVWREKVEDASAGVLILGLVICILVWYVTDYRLHEKTRERNRQLAIDYPQLTSKFVLYMGAGMSVRNVFYKCAEEYRLKTAAGSRKGKGNIGAGSGRWLYEEVLLVCNELDSGVPEADAYMHFGRRCRLRQYTKFCTLLVQNLRRGNDTLLQVLREEAETSFEERKNLVRELGEEAGTRLLLPMMIMLGITMLMIIVPAYFSFSM
jgi:hypothetical protein